MSHFLEIVSILIISVTKQSVYGSTHALVGNYSELNPKDCGITRFTPNLDYSCFKWHKNIIGGMKGRNATEDEVPWIVQVFIRLSKNSSELGQCTGAFIADHWVLTASHCLIVDEPEMYFIIPGIHLFKDLQKTKSSIIRANRVIKHPGFRIINIVESDEIFTSNDIGLIELNKRSIDSIKGSEQLVPFKSICLPQKNVFNAEQVLAMFGCWGQVDRYQWPLQVGINLIYPPDDYATELFTFMILSRRMDNTTLTCAGDSGGPLWQYYNGRAVIIGINSINIRQNSSKCETQDYVAPNFFVRVSKYIDWIKSVTQLN